MTTDRDTTTRVVRSWLQTDEHESAERLLDAVLDRIDTTPQRRAIGWPARRFPTMNNAIRIGLAAAIVVGLAIVGLNVFRDGGVGDSPPSNEATTTPSPSAVAARFPSGVGMEPGTYSISEPFPVDIELTLAESWFPWTPGVGMNAAAMFQNSADPPGGRVIVFAIVNKVYSDPCVGGSRLVDPGPAAADLAAALAGQPNTEATDPVAVTISGYGGVYIDYTNTGGCGTLQRWPSVFGNREALGGERDQVWILDVEGVHLVIDAASFSETDESDLAEMRTIIESLTITP